MRAHSPLRSRSSRRIDRGRRSTPHRFTPAFQDLEGRELLSTTTLLWSAGVSLPSPRGGLAAVSAYGSIDVLGGKTIGPATAVNQLASNTSSWTTFTNTIDSSRVGPGLASAGPTSLFVFGGGGGSQGNRAIDLSLGYNFTGGNNTDLSPMQTARMQLASATDSSWAYAIGGVDDQGHNLSSVERYDPSADNWTYLAPLPAAVSGAAAAFDGSGSIYVVGGSPTVNGSTGSSTLYRYSIAAGTWSTLAPSLYNVRDAAAVVAPDGTLEVIGGVSNGKTIASVETFDPTFGKWTANTPLPSPISSAAAVVDSQNRVEIIGGFDASKAPQASVEVTQVFGVAISAPTITSTAPPAAGSGLTYTYQVKSAGNPLPSYTLVSGPTGMTIDPVNGLLSWTSPPTFLGTVPASISATNALGTSTQSFTISVTDKTPPTPPTSPTVVSVTTTSATITWGASTDNFGVTGYSVYWIYTTGHSGRGGGYTTHTILMATTNGATTATIGGLKQGSSYSLYVTAQDAAGNSSGYSPVVYASPGALPQNFTYTPPSGQNAYHTITDVANHPISITFTASSPSPVTYSVVNGPNGLVVDPNSGAMTWTPSAANVGTSSVTFLATNQFGSTPLVLTFIVTPDVPVPDFVFTNTSSPTFSVVGFPIGLTITDASLTPSTYSVVSAPSNVSIDPVTGVVNWIPTPDQAGAVPVTFRLTNAAGTATVSLSPVIYIADAPGNVAVTGTATWSPTLSWSPPAFNDNLVASYRILISGPNFSTYNLTTDASTTSVALTGLAYNPATYYVNIQALDASGNQGLWNNVVSFVYNPVIPDPYYQITSNNGATTVPVGQPVTIQLYDFNTALTSTFSVVAGPAGLVVDPVGGLATWTPTLDQLGLQPMTFRLTNSAGTADISLQFDVTTGNTRPPNPTYTFLSNNGGAYAVADQPLTIQVSDLNTAEASTFSLASGPAGMTIDPATGLVNWTPTLADLGYAYPVVAATNSIGTTDLTLPIPVVFASEVNAVNGTGSLASQSIALTWLPPSTTDEPIAGYIIYLSWLDGLGNLQYSLAATPPDATSLTLASMPGVTSYTIYIVATDASGNEGAFPALGTPVTPA